MDKSVQKRMTAQVTMQINNVSTKREECVTIPACQCRIASKRAWWLKRHSLNNPKPNISSWPWDRSSTDLRSSTSTFAPNLCLKEMMLIWAHCQGQWPVSFGRTHLSILSLLITTRGLQSFWEHNMPSAMTAVTCHRFPPGNFICSFIWFVLSDANHYFCWLDSHVSECDAYQNSFMLPASLVSRLPTSVPDCSAWFRRNHRCFPYMYAHCQQK